MVAPHRNVTIANSSTTTTIDITPRWLVARLLAIPPLLGLAYLLTGLFAVTGMAMGVEGGVSEVDRWTVFALLLLSGIIPCYFCAMLLFSAFVKKRIVIDATHFTYRFSACGVGRTRIYERSEIGVASIPEFLPGHNPVVRFLGLSSPRFRLRSDRQKRTFGGDISGYAAGLIADALREHRLPE